jgi:hypothetical protein
LDKILIEQYLLQHDLTSLDFSGVETTLCLIQAALAWCENPDSLSLPLTFSSAIIRFLNLTSHVGFNKFGLTKIHEVAEKFNIPGEKKNNCKHSKYDFFSFIILFQQLTILLFNTSVPNDFFTTSNEFKPAT